jgi:alkylhydroperoxidase/carboxymuconolactone decarboxylase family protein YurZ
VGDIASKPAELPDQVLFGDLWARPELAQRDRSLITVAALVTNRNMSGDRGPEAGVRRRQARSLNRPKLQRPLYDIIEALVAIGGNLGVSAAEVSLARSMNRSGVASLVIAPETTRSFWNRLRSPAMMWNW